MTLVQTVKIEKSAVKFGCEKAIRIASEKAPRLVYPYFDDIVDIMKMDNKILKWGAIITLSNLASVDDEGKIERIFDDYFTPIKGKVMITAANIIGNSWKIVKSKPHLTDKIVCEILKLEGAVYENKGEVSPECKNIVRGAAIDAFDKIFEQTNKKNEIAEFVKKQQNNTRAKVKKKADSFLKKHLINK